MDDNTHTLLEEEGVSILAFRVEGEDIDLLGSLEYLSEFIDEEAVSRADKLMIISDKRYEITPADVIGPKMETKREDDERLFKELKGKLRDKLKPLVFTVENDILDLYRVAIRMDGSMKRTGESVGMDLLKVELPKEGDVIYLIFDDGYNKMNRTKFRSLADNAMEGLRSGPSLAKDPSGPTMERSSIREPKAAASILDRPAKAPMKPAVPTKSVQNPMPDDPKILIREFGRSVSSIGYRKDTLFSRPDVNQAYFVGMKGPALLVKYLEDMEELEPFLRILDHRKDSLGILITKEWDPEIEAISRIRGFIYLDRNRAHRAGIVVSGIIREGGI